jgi:hypothetical protein
MEDIPKVKVKSTLEQAMKAQRGNRSIALLFFNLDARWGGWSTPHPGRFTLGKDPLPIVEDISICSYTIYIPYICVRRYWLISESLWNKTAYLTCHNKLHVHQPILTSGFSFLTDN